MTAEVAVAALSRDQARSLTDEVKGDAEALWRKLVGLYEGGAHRALGYGDWGSYFKAEFGGSRSRAYQLLDAGRVMNALEPIQNFGLPANDIQARELLPLKNDPEALREAWAEVVERNPEPTAADVREVVAERLPAMSRKAEMNANAATRKFNSALAAIDGYRLALADFSVERALALATPDDIAAWDRILSNAIAGLGRVRKTIREGM